MKNFKGFDDWIEIFRGGKQTDSEGNEHDGDDLIDKAIAGFNAAEHEPPVVVGHPVENAPAFGWVQELKADVDAGIKILKAKLKQVVPEFEEIVKQGLFKKRSASFYPDGRLRHVGFLGAAPPAVKGLKDIGFKAGESAYDFINDIVTKKETKMTFKDFIEAFQFWKTVEKDPAVPMPVVVPQPAPEKPVLPHFSEAELKAKIDEAVNAEKSKITAEFSEREKKREITAGIDAWCNQMAQTGKLVPAWIKSGIKNFMLQLEGSNTFEFAEGKKQSQLDWFKQFVAELPKLVEFKEIASRENNVDPAANAAKLLSEAVTRKMTDKPNLSYAAAFHEVQIERPDLVILYNQELGKGN
jgi:hypothetical protein